VISALVREELLAGPKYLLDYFESFGDSAELVSTVEEMLDLRNAYLVAGAVSQKWSADALHVAIATMSGCAALVSWNFKHLVNFRRISMYNAVNVSRGYGPVAIHTPEEMIYGVKD